MRNKLAIAVLPILILLSLLPAFAQTAVIQGNVTIQGNVVIPAPATLGVQVQNALFSMHEHSIADANAYPAIPFLGFRMWNTNCQWSNQWVSGDTYNYGCLASFIAYANTFNPPLDIIFTIGQTPAALSTINPDNTATVPASFPVAANGVTIACDTSNNCVATITTLQRLNACAVNCPAGSADQVTVTGSTGCPENPNGTFSLTTANNQTDYPWTYSYPIGIGSTSSSGCGGSAIFIQDNAQTSTRCSGINAGGWCYSPNDITVGGTGPDSHFGLWFTGLLSYLSANDPTHRVKVIEMWNEPQGAGYFNGSIKQTVRMTKDARTILNSSGRTDILLASPAPSGGLTAPGAYLTLYGGDSGNPLQYVNQIGFHSYSFSTTNASAPDPMAVLVTAANVNAAVAPFAAATGKPHWVTEGGWGSGQWALNGPLGPNSGTTAIADKAGWVADAYMAHQCSGVQRYYWFAWDQRCNTGLACATTPPPYSIQPAGIAFGIAYDKLVGANVLQPCAKDAQNNWTMLLTRTTGYQELVVWNTGLTTVGSYTIPAGVYTQYTDVNGDIHSIAPTQTSVPVQFDPIWLETGPPHLHITSSLTLPPQVVGVAITPFCLTATSSMGALNWKERSLPRQFSVTGTGLSVGATGLSLDSSGCFTGTPTATGTFTSQIGTIDTVSNEADAQNFTIAITNPASVVITSSAPPNGMQSTPYNGGTPFPITATGGIPPYTCTIPLTGTLPAGLSQSGCSITGTPTTPNTYNFTVKICDATTTNCATSPTYTVIITASSGGNNDNLYCGVGNVPTFGSTDGPAQLPQSCYYTARSASPSPGTLHSAHTASDLTGFLSTSACGDIIELDPGVTYSGHFVYAKACDASHYITIRSKDWYTGLSQGPAEFTRVSPCWAGLASEAGYPSFNCSSTTVRMAKLSTPDSSPLWNFSGGSFLRIIGVEMTRAVGTGVNFVLINSLNNVADHIIFDQTYVHGTPVAVGNNDDTVRGMAVTGMNMIAVVDSFWSDFWCSQQHNICTDAQAISANPSIHVSPTFKVVNNFMSAAAETLLWGGATVDAGTNEQTDIEVRSNWMFKPFTWHPNCVAPLPTFCGGVTFAGLNVLVKNLYEHKQGNRVLIEGNVMQNVWPGYSQVGEAITLTPRQFGSPSNSAGNLCCFDTNITTRYNYISTACQIFQSGSDAGSQGQNHNIFHDNVADNLTYDTNGNGFSCTNGGQYLTRMISPNSTSGVTGVTITTGGTCSTGSHAVTFSGGTPNNGGFPRTAQGTASVVGSTVTGITITDAGANYATAPAVSVAGCTGFAGAPTIGGVQVPASTVVNNDTFDHNSIVTQLNGTAGLMDLNGPAAGQPMQVTGFTYTNNVEDAGSFGFFSSSQTTFSCTAGQNASNGSIIAACYPAINFDCNWVVRGSNHSDAWPAGTHCGATSIPSDYSTILFTNYNGGISNGSIGNYLLQNASPGHHAGTDGRDLGAAISTVQSKISGVNSF